MLFGTTERLLVGISSNLLNRLFEFIRAWIFNVFSNRNTLHGRRTAARFNGLYVFFSPSTSPNLGDAVCDLSQLSLFHNYLDLTNSTFTMGLCSR